MSSLYVDIRPLYLDLAVGAAGLVAVSITNSSSTIDGYRIRVFGLDPEWVTVTPARVAVFPGETVTVEIALSLPTLFPAGARQFTVQVVSENDPDDFSLVQLSANIANQPRARLKMDPVSVVGGKRATFSLIVFNDGNAPIHAIPEGVDPEETATFEFVPPSVDVKPGRRETVEVRVVGKRPWLGGPKARVLSFAVTTPQRVEAVASFVQRPRISRWLLSLMGLVAAAAVFAAVLSHSFEAVVDEASVDDDVLNRALDQGEAGGAKVPLNPLSITGMVTSRTSGEGIAGVEADLFLEGDIAVPLFKAATTDDGSYAFGRLAAGTYVLRFSGAGFADIWYPDGAAPADAGVITLTSDEPGELDPVEIGGRPGSISGLVIIDDPKGVTATLFLEGQIDVDTNAVVQKVKVGAEGGFAFENVASPNTYTLLVEKPGYAPDVRQIVLLPAQVITGIEVTLRQGNGAILGQVTSPGGPLGGVLIEATDGTTRISTASLTEGALGTFVLRGLPTPGTYTVTVRRAGFVGASRTITLGQAERVTDVLFTLARATGTLRGTVNLAGAGPLGGVKVTVTGSDVEISTTTISQGNAIGTYLLEGLPIPATYTISFSRAGLVPQVRLQDLDPFNGTADASGLDATMFTATAVVKGVIRGSDGQPVALAEVVLSDGTTTRVLSTAHTPLGEFEFAAVPPGTYTLGASLPGTTSAVVLVNVSAAEIKELDIQLAPQASVFGLVMKFDIGLAQFVPFENATVRLFRAGDFPGSPGLAFKEFTTGATGAYEFLELEAPADFVVAIYVNDISLNPLESRLLVTQPSFALSLDPFEIVL